MKNTLFNDSRIKVTVKNNKAVSIEAESNILDIENEEERRAALKHYEPYTLKAIEYSTDFDCDIEVVFNNCENPEKGTKTGVIVAVPTEDGYKIALREWTDYSYGSLNDGTYTPFFGNSSYTMYPRFYDHYIGTNPIVKLAEKVTGIKEYGGTITFYTGREYTNWTIISKNDYGQYGSYRVVYDYYTGYDLEWNDKSRYNT